MANLANLTLNEKVKESQILNLAAEESLSTPRPALAWNLYVDGSSNYGGCRANLIFSSPKPECLRIEYALRLGFKAPNNETEYKALLVGLRLAYVKELNAPTSLVTHS